MEKLRVMGIDPGTGRLGWSIVEVEGGKESLVKCGCFETTVNSPLPERLIKVHQFTRDLIKEFKPNEVAIEELFFATNAKTAMSVGMARGVVVLAVKEEGLESYDYPPLKIKMAITGYGKADKKQVQFMVKQILKLSEVPKPDDAADAVAVALTHITSRKLKARVLQ